jgi:aminoglycoside/choline kinase family phosphotransferase
MPLKPESHSADLLVAGSATGLLPIEDLRRLLQKLFPGGPPPFQVIPLRGDASDRQYYRLRFPSPIDGLTSLVLMHLSQLYTAGELPFVNVQRYLALKGLSVPHLYADDAVHGFVVLEDLGDVTLECASQNASQEQIGQWYRQALDMLLTMQNPESQAPRASCVAFRLAFDVDKFMWELDFFLTHMVQGLCGQRLTMAEETALRGQFWKLAADLARQPRVLTHRDYHSRNLMLHEGHLRVIDFQDARLGPCHYDLASLLYDAYVVLPSELRSELLDYYLDGKDSMDGYPANRDTFLHIFDYMCLQRHLKALGTFGFQIAVKHNTRYAAAIPVTLGYVQRHLAGHPELHQLKDLLETYLFAACAGGLPGVERHTPDNFPTHSGKSPDTVAAGPVGGTPS